MNLQPTEEQRMLRDSIDRFAREHAQASPETLLAGLTGLGLLALAAPEAAGGLGGSGDDLLMMMEAVGHGLLAVPLASTVAALDLLGRHGTAAQQDTWLAPAIEGARRLAYVPLDAGDYSDGRLSGRAALVPGAAGADALLVIAAEQAFVVESAAPGLELAPLRLVDGTIAAQVRLDRVAADPVPVTAEAIADSIARASVAASAQMLGIIERLVADTLEQVKTREQFGVAIGRFQTIQHRMARLFVITGQCRSAVMAAAFSETGAHGDWFRRVSAAKALVSDQGLHLAHECVQFHGGMGITQELGVSRGHRQLAVLARLFGSAAEARRDFDRLAG